MLLNTIYIIFVTLGIVDLVGPLGGVSFTKLKPSKYSDDINYKYSASKASNWFLVSEFDKWYVKDGIISVA